MKLFENKKSPPPMAFSLTMKSLVQKKLFTLLWNV